GPGERVHDAPRRYGRRLRRQLRDDEEGQGLRPLSAASRSAGRQRRRADGELAMFLKVVLSMTYDIHAPTRQTKDFDAGGTTIALLDPTMLLAAACVRHAQAARAPAPSWLQKSSRPCENYVS